GSVGGDCLGHRLLEAGEDLAIELGMRLPGLASHHLAVADRLLRVPGAPGRFYFVAHVLVARHLGSRCEASAHQHLDAVADGENPAILVPELAHDAEYPLVVAQV